LLLACGARAQPPTEVDFIPYSAAYGYAARAYRAIWDEHGERIVAALETRTCLKFPELKVEAVIADAGSHSGVAGGATFRVKPGEPVGNGVRQIWAGRKEDRGPPKVIRIYSFSVHQRPTA
jgi:hypothetical protein